MTKPLFKIQSVINEKKNKKTKAKTPNFCFSRHRAAADLHQTLQEDRGCPYHFCSPLTFSIRPVVSEPGDSENFSVEMPHRVFCL